MRGFYTVLFRSFRWLSACIPGIAIDFWDHAQSMTALHHGYSLRWTAVLWGGVSFLVLHGLERVRYVLYRRMNIGRPPAPVLSTAIWTLFLVPIVSARWFWTGEDLRVRWISAAVLIGMAYLWLAWRDALVHAIGRCSERTLCILAVGLCLIVQAALGLGYVWPRLGWTGDEPHYLVVTESIVQDHDLDVGNNYRAPSAVLQHIGIHPRTVHGRTRVDGTGVVSFHMPGLALLQVPAYLLSSVFRTRGAFWFYLTMMGVALWVTVESFRLLLVWTRSPPRAFIGTVLLMGTVPVVFYGHHLYPELVVLGIVIHALRVWFTPGAGSWHLLGVGLAIGTLPFWGVKYLGIVAAWGLLGCWRLWRVHAARGSAARFLAAILIGTAAFFLFLYRVYGTLDPQRVYTERSLVREVLPIDRSETGIAHRLWARVRIMGTSVLNYLLDQRDGLLLYSPIYLLGFLGGVRAFRYRRWAVLPGAVLLAAHIGIHSLGGARIGFSPPGRPFVAVAIVPILWLFTGASPARRPWSRSLVEVLGGYSLIMPWWMAAVPSSIYQSTAWYVTRRAGLAFERLSNLLGYLPDILPSYLQGMAGPWWPNVVWPLLLIGVIVVGARFRSRNAEPAGWSVNPVSRTAGAVCAALAVAWLAGYPRFVPDMLHHVKVAPDTTWYYPEKDCTVETVRPYVWATTCRRRMAYTFALAASRTFHAARIRIFCYPVGRRFRAEIRWFDVPLHPTAAVGSQTVYTVHWPFWPKFRGLYWTALFIRADTPRDLPCRRFVMWTDLKTDAYSR